MFKWLFRTNAAEAKDNKGRAADPERFEGAYQMVLTRAAALKKEYDRTYADPTIDLEVRKNLETYKDPAYLVGSRNTILSTAQDSRYKAVHEILPVVATMFMTMATEVFPSNAGFERFSSWANSFPDVQKSELVRFAYLSTVWEQEQAGSTHPVAFASRMILMTLAANANDDSTSKEVARELFAYIDRLRDRKN